jgi:peroxiredoxin
MKNAILLFIVACALILCPSARAAQSLDLLIVDQATQKPLAGAQIAQLGKQTADAIANAEGHGTVAVAAGKPASLYRLVIQHPGYVAKLIAWPYATIPASATVTLEPAASIGGHVSDESGAPLAGAHVVVSVDFDGGTNFFFNGKSIGQASAEFAEGGVKLSNPAQRIFFHAGDITTGSDGTWSCDGLPASYNGMHISIAAWDYALANDDPLPARNYVPLDHLHDGSLKIVMQRGVAVTGTVFGSDGSTLAGAAVGMGFNRSSPNCVPDQITDASGKFAYAAKPGTQVVLTVTAKGQAPQMAQFVMRDQPVDLPIHLSPGHHLSGRVVDESGNPVPHPEIYVDNWRGNHTLATWIYADDKGHFTWDDAPPDAVHATIAATGFMREGGIMTADGKEIVIALLRPLPVSGTVVDADTGEKIPTFRLTPGIVFDPSRPVYWQNASRTFHDGEFQFAETEHASGYAVRVDADGYLPVASRVFKIDEKNVTLDMKLTKGSGPDLVVQSPQGWPAVGATAVLATPGQTVVLYNGTQLESGNALVVKADAYGHVKFPAQIGNFRVMIFGDAGYAETDQDAISKSQTVTIEPWARIDGQLMIGRTMAFGEKIFAEAGDPRVDPNQAAIRNIITTKTDAAGQFSCDRVPPGYVQISHEVDRPTIQGVLEMRSQTQRLTLTPGQTATVRLGGVGRPVTGRLVPPVELAGRTDWYFGYCQMTTKLNLSPPPVPADVRAGSADMQRQWLVGYLKTDAGKALAAAERTALENQHSYPLPITQDGSFRIDDVVAGTYELTATITRQSALQANQPGEDLAYAHTEITVPEMPDGRSDEPLVGPVIPMTMYVNLSPGEPAPDFSAQTLDGKTWSLSDYRGKIVLLDFWAAWSAPSMAEVPAMKSVYDKYSSNPNFAMISLSVDTDADSPRAIIAKNDLHWPQAVLPGGGEAQTVKDYGVRGVPSVWLIGADGKVLAKNLPEPAIPAAVGQALGK